MANGDLSASEAYIRAGYSENGKNGHSARQVAKGSIKARIAHLRAKLAKKLEITRETIAKEAEEHRQIALDISRNGGKIDLAGANGALTIKAKACGLLTDVVRDDTNRTDISAQRRKEAREAASKLLQSPQVISIKRSESA
jgi:hypothetical protein